VTGTSLDKGVELDALAKLPKDERKGPKITAVDDGRAEITSDCRRGRDLQLTSGLRRLVSWRREENASFF
jgi:hypothetical protein